MTESESRCPRCGSPSPEFHPAVAHEGETLLCADDFHLPRAKGEAPSDEVEFLAQAFALSDPAAVRRMIEGGEIAEFATAPRDGRQVLAWNGRAWEIVQFDTRSDRWESTYRGRGCELVAEELAARFTLWAPLPVVVTW